MATFATERSNTFYLDTIVFQVENTLYRVPRWGFEGQSAQGSPFEVCASLPSGPNVPVEGKLDENPIHLAGVQKSEFESFLKIIYAPQPRPPINHFGIEAPSTKREWLDILKLSTMWNFEIVRGKAVTALSRFSLSNMEKITLGRQYGMSEWLVGGFVGISCDLTLRIADLELDRETKLALYSVRDHFFSQQLANLAEYYRPNYYSLLTNEPLDSGSWKDYVSKDNLIRDLTKLVREVLSKEIGGM